jgi:hypothetical protein
MSFQTDEICSNYFYILDLCARKPRPRSKTDGQLSSKMVAHSTSPRAWPCISLPEDNISPPESIFFESSRETNWAEDTEEFG